MQNNKKGNVNMLLPLIIGLVVAGLIVGFGAQIMTSIQSTFTSGSFGYNATVQGLTGVTYLADQFPNVGTVAAAVIIIGLLVGGFAAYAGRGR